MKGPASLSTSLRRENRPFNPWSWATSKSTQAAINSLLFPASLRFLFPTTSRMVKIKMLSLKDK